MVINKGVISKIKPPRDLKVEEIKETLKNIGNSQRLNGYSAIEILELLVLKLHKMTRSERHICFDQLSDVFSLISL